MTLGPVLPRAAHEPEPPPPEAASTDGAGVGGTRGGGKGAIIALPEFKTGEAGPVPGVDMPTDVADSPPSCENGAREF